MSKEGVRMMGWSKRGWAVTFWLLRAASGCAKDEQDSGVIKSLENQMGAWQQKQQRNLLASAAC